MVSGLKDRAKKKNKLVFAKDKNQAIAAIVVASLFILNTVYTGIKMYIENHPRPVAASAANTPDPLTSLQNPATPGEMQAPGNIEQTTNDIYSQTVALQGNNTETIPVATNGLSNSVGDDVEIISKNSLGKSRRGGKTVTVAVENTGRSNPFLPAMENFSSAGHLPLLTAPPETIPTDSDAQKVITTTISGILYDKYTPSAIINIEGSDYLVKKGDVINHYKILSISKTQVLVQLGRNVYKAGVGELLSKTDLNYNTIANLEKKFGGNQVQISIKKKKK